ncbi:MAG TPA: hypothetical protein VGS22_14135 [Thermoanaerobaculia bacterium]|jgi:hypothetical protein|nr:hypothetical protein [Thermoanaerobaculia bacterium]
MAGPTLLDDVAWIWRTWASRPARLWALTLAVFFVFGALVLWALPVINIAYWARPWQFATLYCGFVAPLAILIRDQPWHRQYAYSLLAIMPLELVALNLGTTIPYPHNLLEPVVGPRCFALAMVLIDSWIPYVGNRIVALLWRPDSTRRAAT